MSKGQIEPTKEEVQQLYDPNYFYEYGDNPAMKKYMEIAVENQREGKMRDTRTYVRNNYTRYFILISTLFLLVISFQNAICA